MPAALIQVMIHIGFLVQREQSYVIACMLPDELKDLVEETEEGIQGACVGYTKIPPVVNSIQRFNVSWPALRRLISIMIWANDKRRLGKDVEFLAGITAEDLRKKINEAEIRDQRRKSQNEDGGAILADRSTTSLRKSPQ